jgi:hypothetical protein
MTLVTAPAPRRITPRPGRPSSSVLAGLVAVATLLFGLMAFGLSGASAGAAPQASVAVSKTDVADTGETVTVTGTGFDPAAHQGTRPPFAGQNSGVYVVFGTFDQPWGAL